MPEYNQSSVQNLMSTPAININDKRYDMLLNDLQANILRHHKKRFVKHVFISFKEDKVNEARQKIGEFACFLSKAGDQLKKVKDNKPIYCFYLTSAGYDFLGMPHLRPMASNAFVRGIDENVENGFDIDNSNFTKKNFGKSNPLHAMALIASNDFDKEDVKKMKDFWEDFKDGETYTQLGELEFDDKKKEIIPTEWFGYKDGISQPVFFPSNKFFKNKPQIKHNDVSPLELLLVEDPGGNAIDNGERVSFGSYLVFMKFEQKIDNFNNLINEEATKIAKNEAAKRVRKDAEEKVRREAEKMINIEFGSVSKEQIKTTVQELVKWRVGKMKSISPLEWTRELARMNLLRKKVKEKIRNEKKEISGKEVGQLVEKMMSENWSEWAEELAKIKDDELNESNSGKLVKKEIDNQVNMLNERSNRNVSVVWAENLAKAKIVGRFLDGKPLTCYIQDKDIHSDASNENNFDYSILLPDEKGELKSDSNGSRCPLSAHIRKVNPRNKGEGYQYHKIARRGVLYKDDNEKGLLFMSFQSSLEYQFELLVKEQIHGVQGSGAYGGAVAGKDELLKKREGGKSLVTYKGGAYFFAPSISFLQRLNMDSHLSKSVQQPELSTKKPVEPPIHSPFPELNSTARQILPNVFNSKGGLMMGKICFNDGRDEKIKKIIEQNFPQPKVSSLLISTKSMIVKFIEKNFKF